MGRVALFAALFLASACKKDGSEDDDRARLSTVLAADAKVDAFLGEADRLDRLGRANEAAVIVDTEATPALNDARRLLEETPATTSWGRERRTELVKLLDDRAAVMPTYVAALKSTDPKAKLDVAQAQATLEKRALGIAASMKKKEPAP